MGTKTREELFHEFNCLSLRLKYLSSIVQNEAPLDTKALQEWNDRAGQLIYEVYDLKEEVNRFFVDKER